MGEHEVEIEQWDSQPLRRRVLQLAETVGRGPAAYFRLVELDGDVRYANMAATQGIREKFVRNEGRLAHNTSVVHKTSLRKWTVGSPRAQSRNQFNTFEEDYGKSLRLMQGNDTHEAFYGPAEITDQARALMYDGDEFLGFIAVMRRGGERFERASVEALNEGAAELHRLLLLARTAEREEDTGALHLIANEAGDVLYADQRARCWLTRRRTEHLKDSLAYGRVFAIDGVAASVGWLDDGNRKLRHIALSQVEPLRVSNWHHLSQTQRDIVAFALDGLSNREIARLNQISQSTVKYHLNEAARTLDVRGRSGLRQALRGRGGVK